MNDSEMCIAYLSWLLSDNDTERLPYTFTQVLWEQVDSKYVLKIIWTKIWTQNLLHDRQVFYH